MHPMLRERVAYLAITGAVSFLSTVLLVLLLINALTARFQALDAIRRGENVVTVTGTASGKTLCYNIPVLETLLQEPKSKALYLFPTKALAHDQEAETAAIIAAARLPVPVGCRECGGYLSANGRAPRRPPGRSTASAERPLSGSPRRSNPSSWWKP